MSKALASTKALLAAVGAGAVLLKAVRFGMEVFGPARPYRLPNAASISVNGDGFASKLALATDALLHRDTQVAVLMNGTEFYPAELDAIRKAERSIHVEAYEFQTGDVTRTFIEVLTEKARNGVGVRLTIDAIGSWRTPSDYFDILRKAGGKVVLYHRILSRDWPYYDHRTHRKLLIVDGRTGFVGGAGFADHWLEQTNGQAPWRDTMFRVEGNAAISLDATFAQNWVSSTGEVLFPHQAEIRSDDPTANTCMVIMSSPGYGATRARVLFQILMDSAKSTIDITSPYFLPDHSARHALIRAVKQRGVKVRVLTAGNDSDHNSVRRLSEAMSAKLIRSGIEFYEYQPGMIHAKLMTIDGAVTVAGSTNFDHRSFALNSEVNLAVCDRNVTQLVESQFEQDLAQSCRMTPQEIQSHGFESQATSTAAWVLRREA